MRELNRRQLLFAVTGAAIAVRVPLQLTAADAGAPLFFTKKEFETLDVLTELMIPADDHSPGARAAGVAPFIDRTVAEAFMPEDKSSWRHGLAAIDELSQSMYRIRFSKATAQQQTDLLNSLAKNEKNPGTPAERFFTQLKQTTAFAYYSSSVGIHQDMNYKGNVLLEQFAGYEVT